MAFMYSSWKCRVLFVEDVFIVEEERGKGIGKHLFMLMSRLGQATDCARLQWMVSPGLLNQPAVEATHPPFL